ncbi:aminotransferase class I/II-fold pyridoxal phosphate-dependent enzyme [Candidatus Poribacteria bacterium]|nr:aminotransferase class I/II-fold pyridoxal phosphate-dependent enzyme [Candidatus Poribacteria bacterium]
MSKEKLAIDGGSPVITEGIPGGMHGPTVIDHQEIDAVTAVLKSQKLFRFCENSNVAAFEQQACEHVGVKHSLMVNSGTSALVCCLTGVGVGPGDEVIVPGYTYISTAASVVGVGGVPVITEIDESLGLDPKDVEKKITPYTKAIIPVYMQGVPARINAIMEIAKKHNLKVVEDCCQCIGGRYKGKYVGTIGNAGAWSLNYYKVITAGEGGLVLTDEYEVYEKSAFASDPAMPMWMSESEWQSPPFSRQCYRPSEVLGAIARVQLGKMETILTHTRKLKKAFLSELAEPKGYVRQHVDDPEGDCGISAAIIIRDQDMAHSYAEALRAEGLGAGTAYNDGFPDRHIYKYWDSILDKNSHHPTGYPWKDPAYMGNVEYSRDMCPVTLSILGRALRFGFNMNMEEEHAKLMAAAINKVDAALG